MALHLAHLQPRCTAGVLGPGERFGVWVQGCPRRCPGCFNPDFLPFGTQQPHVQVIDSQDLIGRILDEHRRAPLAGVTFTGGEPLSQARPLAEVATAVQHHGLSVVVFTGYTTPQLGIQDGELRVGPGTSPDVSQLLAHTDLLVAGPFVEARKLERPDLRGSANQQVLLLTDRVEVSSEPPPVGVQVTAEGGVEVTGFPDPALRQYLSVAFDRTLN